MGELELSDAVFDVKPNADMLHQVIVGCEANSRGVFAHTKTRGEVRGGGKKPWKQKGTGRARHGSTRSPLWIGGGITFGPRNNRNFKVKLNKKIKDKALCMILTDKVKNNELIAVEKFAVAEPKTRLVSNIVKTLLEKAAGPVKSRTQTRASATSNGAGKKSGPSTIIADADKNLKLACRNMENVKVVSAKDLNILGAIKSRYLIIDKNVLSDLEKRLTSR